MVSVFEKYEFKKFGDGEIELKWLRVKFWMKPHNVFLSLLNVGFLKTKKTEVNF